MAPLIPQVSCPNISSNKFRALIPSHSGHRDNVCPNKIYSPMNMVRGLLNSNEFLLGIWIGLGWKAGLGRPSLPILEKAIVQRGRRMRGCSLGSWEKAAHSPRGDQQRQRCWHVADSSLSITFRCPALNFLFVALGSLNTIPHLPYPPLFPLKLVWMGLCFLCHRDLCLIPHSEKKEGGRSKNPANSTDLHFLSKRDVAKLPFPDGSDITELLTRNLCLWEAHSAIFLACHEDGWALKIQLWWAWDPMSSYLTLKYPAQSTCRHFLLHSVHINSFKRAAHLITSPLGRGKLAALLKRIWALDSDFQELTLPCGRTGES